MEIVGLLFELGGCLLELFFELLFWAVSDRSSRGR